MDYDLDIAEDQIVEQINKEGGYLLCLLNFYKEKYRMSAKDLFHQSVRIAMEKDGWQITNDPLYLKVNDVEFYIDLGAERLIAAEKLGQKIAVEIKSFLGTSAVTEFHLALGQILNYRLALKQEYPQLTLYLAIPKDTYDDFFSRQFIQDSVAEYQIKLLIFDSVKQEIVLWKE